LLVENQPLPQLRQAISLDFDDGEELDRRKLGRHGREQGGETLGSAIRLLVVRVACARRGLPVERGRGARKERERTRERGFEASGPPSHARVLTPAPVSLTFLITPDLRREALTDPGVLPSALDVLKTGHEQNHVSPAPTVSRTVVAILDTWSTRSDPLCLP
jgi:hypothetical protein